VTTVCDLSLQETPHLCVILDNQHGILRTIQFFHSTTCNLTHAEKKTPTATYFIHITQMSDAFLRRPRYRLF